VREREDEVSLPISAEPRRVRVIDQLRARADADLDARMANRLGRAVPSAQHHAEVALATAILASEAPQSPVPISIENPPAPAIHAAEIVTTGPDAPAASPAAGTTAAQDEKVPAVPAAPEEPAAADAPASETVVFSELVWSPASYERSTERAARRAPAPRPDRALESIRSALDALLSAPFAEFSTRLAVLRTAIDETEARMGVAADLGPDVVGALLRWRDARSA
jgi:hypothetical protein